MRTNEKRNDRQLQIVTELVDKKPADDIQHHYLVKWPDGMMMMMMRKLKSKKNEIHLVGRLNKKNINRTAGQTDRQTHRHTTTTTTTTTMHLIFF